MEEISRENIISDEDDAANSIMVGIKAYIEVAFVYTCAVYNFERLYKTLNYSFWAV